MTLLGYRRHRFPPEIIQHAIWLSLRCTLSYRDVEDLLAERGVEISYETVQRWVAEVRACDHPAAAPAALSASDRWHLDEMGATAAWHCDVQAAQEAGLRAEVVGDRQAALLRLGLSAAKADLPS